MRKIIIAITFPLLFVSCNCLKSYKQQSTNPSFALQQTIIYKTIGDFALLVPITMNEGRTEIISYPAPSDLINNGKLTTPTRLNKGYLLDNRGVNSNTVFLNYTYEDYSKLEKAPSLEEMMHNIAEKHPLSELIECGPRSRFKDEIKEINLLIQKDFPACNKLDILPMQINSF